jgi:hypothetical protein
MQSTVSKNKHLKVKRLIIRASENIKCFLVSLRIDFLRDEKQELPEDFLGEIYKWTLECE